MTNRKSSSPDKKRQIILVVGPTAAGKTETAIGLAKKLNGEIISCDSMQIYKGMGILTSKPAAVQRKQVPHHLISMISPTKEYNVSQYRKDAVRKIETIIAKDKTAILVGGTGLYMSVLIDGIFKDKAQDKTIRQRLYREAEESGSGKLYERLKNIDPEAAKKIHPHDTKRIVRALEVFEKTGKPISQLQRQRKGLADEYDVKIFGLDMPRDKLYRRIDERVEKMFAEGLIEEVKKLLKVKLSQTASCAIGIKELKGYFGGLYDLEEAKRLIKRNTHRYAKRQLTWFRKDKRIDWIGAAGGQTPARIAQRIARIIKGRKGQSPKEDL